MAERQSGDGIRVQGGTALKRRGILAAAGVVVAGIVAKQTAEPVAAAAPLQYVDTTTTVTNSASGQTVIIDSVAYTGTDSVFVGQALNGNARCGIQGVSGLRGPAPFRCGVYGDVGTANSVGVFGNANSGAPSIGVQGQSMSGIGVLGQIASGSIAPNAIAIYGVNYSSGANNVGIYGAANTGSDVVGVTYGAGCSPECTAPRPAPTG